ncbi:hypothetical protein BH10PSE17_BH10PSE17_03560 [soil metagenome]
MPINPDEAAPNAASIDEMIEARRYRWAEAGVPITGGKYGLALSGGGIRSATFCLGLVRALSARGVLQRFDLMSTVSGGGYIGGTVGRLFDQVDSDKVDPHDVERALAEADTRWFTTWLRANGRYLIPRGSQDLAFAAANFGRNLLGVHIELAMWGLIIGGLLVGLDLGVWWWADCRYKGGCEFTDFVGIDAFGLASEWPTPWLLLPIPVWVSGVLAWGYWALPSRGGHGLPARRWIEAVAAAALVTWLVYALWSAQPGDASPYGNTAFAIPTALKLMLVAVLTACIGGTVLAAGRTDGDVEVARNRLTAQLATTVKVAMAIGVAGVIDICAWSIATTESIHLGVVGAFLAVSVAVIRSVLSRIADLPKSLAPMLRGVLIGVIDLAGSLTIAALLIFWTSVLHRYVTTVLFDTVSPARGLSFLPSWYWLGLFVVPPLIFVIGSWTNRDFLNRSSLFSFYRARLVRSYLGAANPARFPERNPIGQASGCSNMESPLRSVKDVEAGDDVLMAHYRPHLGGGPVHLINVCVNQTRDLRGGLFNQDRKGMSMTIGPQGVTRIGQGPWQAAPANNDMTLGAWMAISGAAVAPGLGSSTRSGLAALLTLCGIRLGYWWNSPDSLHVLGTKRHAIGKYGQLFSELIGRFDGIDRKDWYLSDGGHFENTGAYALLSEQCKVIVMADCGADPRYAFGDLENLVRKARIDLQAEITFLKPKVLDAKTASRDDLEITQIFGSLNQLSSVDSSACLALASVLYRNTTKSGYMVIVKPNMCQRVPVDLVNFKADNPLFPQEPTTDQFFSEAQWESYYQLGRTLGLQLPVGVLEDLPKLAPRLFDRDDGSVIALDAAGEQTRVAAPKRLHSRIISTGAVSATIGLGGFATLAATTWDTVDTRMKAIQQARALDPGVLKEVSDLFGKLSPGGLPMQSIKVPSSGGDTRLGELATALLRISDAACTEANKQAFRDSDLMQLIVETTRQGCVNAGDGAPKACEKVARYDVPVPCIQKDVKPACVRSYWIRDYAQINNPDALNCRVDLASLQPQGWPTEPPPKVRGPVRPSPPGVETPPDPAPAPVQVAAPLCASQTVYIQIFGPELRDLASQYRAPWQLLGANVPPIEDVVDTARRANRTPPQSPVTPTVIYHKPASLDCANEIAKAGAGQWNVVPLASRLLGTPGVIEVWFPPAPRAGRAPGYGYCYQEQRPTSGPQQYGVHCHATMAACSTARGPNPQRRQSDCAGVDLTDAGARLSRRGWMGSWYDEQAAPYPGPFPQLRSP